MLYSMPALRDGQAHRVTDRSVLDDNISDHAVAMTLVKQWFSRFGIPDNLTTVQGLQFEADLFRTLPSTFGIQHTSCVTISTE